MDYEMLNDEAQQPPDKGTETTLYAKQLLNAREWLSRLATPCFAQGGKLYSG